jgi:hypothetical protein
MLNLPLYNNQKLLLSFEYGIILSQVAQERELALTAEIITRAETILLAEFKKNNATKLSTEMIGNILAMIEPSV